MKSPFPGMDPYLERQNDWRDFHTRLIISISDVLAERVSPKFIVRVEERVDIIEFGVLTGVISFPTHISSQNRHALCVKQQLVKLLRQP